jgi:pSer/pThr/pTyr-binding forkhead associated (FHA) protein/tetratricopeptide (TPR) repeat protein
METPLSSQDEVPKEIEVSPQPENSEEPPPVFEFDRQDSPPIPEDFVSPAMGNEESPEESPQLANVRDFPLPERISNEPAFEGALALKTENTAIENQSVVAKLIFVEGPLIGKEIPLQGYEITLGRSKKVDVFIDDEKLSRKHTKVARIGNGYRLIDLESRNGTYVNGVRILEHPLNSFDVIEIGNTKIKFLIMDLSAGMMGQAVGLPAVPGQNETKSIQLVVEPPPPPIQMPATGPFSSPQDEVSRPRSSVRNILFGSLVIILVVAYFAIPTNPETDQNPEKSVVIEEQKPITNPDAALLPQIPKEFSDLTPQAQREVEGHYNNSIRNQEREDYDAALSEIKQLHSLVPYYKESKKLEALYFKKLKEKQKDEATERATRDRYAELQIYLEDGIEYLKQGNFDRAAEAFNNALVLEPQNATAAKGLRAAQLKITDIEKLPPEVDPETEKRKLVAQLMEQALLKYDEKAYQDAINLAEQIRTIEIKGETEYLNQAKQLIDKAKAQQKEEFEPFLIQAKEKFAEGDYNLSRDLCDEMLKRDPSYDAAQECSLRARKQLNRLAKEAYTHGYILESMNRIEEAKQYWNRAKNYVRPGDPYFDKIQRKLDNYQ